MQAPCIGYRPHLKEDQYDERMAFTVDHPGGGQLRRGGDGTVCRPQAGLRRQDMTVDDLIAYLQELSVSGKGGYSVIRDGYGDALTMDNICVEIKKGEVWL